MEKLPSQTTAPGNAAPNSTKNLSGCLPRGVSAESSAPRCACSQTSSSSVRTPHPESLVQPSFLIHSENSAKSHTGGGRLQSPVSAPPSLFESPQRAPHPQSPTTDASLHTRPAVP